MRQALFDQVRVLLRPAKGISIGWFCCFSLLLGLNAPSLAHEDDIDSIECAVQLRRAGHIQMSIDMLLRLKATEQANVRVNLELVMGYLKAQQYDQAEQILSGILALSPQMKSNPKLKKLAQMITRARQNSGAHTGLEQNDDDSPLELAQTHQFDFEITTYKGFEELTSQFSYLEITEFEDYFQIELKNDMLTSKYYYSAARLKGEYRFTPSGSFNLFGQPTYTFVSNRLTYFYKQADTLADVDFGYTSLDSSWFVIQPEHWSFNATVKGKWHNYDGDRSLTELKADINLSTLVYGARLKAGISHNQHTLDMSYLQDYYDDDYFIIEQKSRLVSPYIGLSYRVTPSLLLSGGVKRHNILSDNPLLEGRVLSYNATVKFDVTEIFELHLSYSHNDLRYDYFNVDDCFDLNSFECLNSGELKRTITLGSGYSISPHWQIGLNAMYMDKKQDNDFGQDQWKRLEAFVRYRF